MSCVSLSSVYVRALGKTFEAHGKMGVLVDHAVCTVLYHTGTVCDWLQSPFERLWNNFVRTSSWHFESLSLRDKKIHVQFDMMQRQWIAHTSVRCSAKQTPSFDSARLQEAVAKEMNMWRWLFSLSKHGPLSLTVRFSLCSYDYSTASADPQQLPDVGYKVVVK